MKKLFFIGACLVALGSTPVMAQTGTSAVVTVRVSELSGRTELWINWPGREPEFVHFDWRDNDGKGVNAGRGYEEALSKVYEQGYHLEGVIPGLNSGIGFVRSTLIFTKPK